MKNLCNRNIDIENVDEMEKPVSTGWWRDNPSNKEKQMYRYIHRFIEKHIGRSFNKAYTEFLDKAKNDNHFPSSIYGKSLNTIWNNQFGGENNNCRREYTVINGVIRYSKWLNDYNRKKKYATVIKYPQGHNMVYQLRKPNKNIYSYDDDDINIFKEFCKRLTDDYSEDFVNDFRKGISEKKYMIHINHIRALYCDMFCRNNSWTFPKPKETRWGMYQPNIERFIIKKDIAPSYKLEQKKPKKDTPENRRANAEYQDSLNKQWRESDALLKEEADNLLRTIEEKKKAEERAQNIIDRDRLGFDEHSFIGEGYHGQQRKKKTSQ